MRLFIAFLIVLILVVVRSYDIGVGIYDTTGPSTAINFMGYAVPNQRGKGIHLRLRARSFVVRDTTNNKIIAFVSNDGGMGSDLVKQKVIEKLNEKLNSNIFTYDNVCISGTHTHSGPAGFLQYVLFQMTSLGFVQETFDAWVNGITESILMAYNNIESDVSINFSQGNLFDSNINRSPTSYLLNPEAERAKYEDIGDTDKNMVMIKFTKGNKMLGAFNWFAVHATSMNNTNMYVSGDNKGYAAYALEKDINGADSLPGTGPFVAGFCSTNLGDVSPNTNGAKCIDTGEPCDGTTSTCNGRCEKCIAFGPGKDMFESTKIIGDKQYQFAKTLLSNAKEEITGSVDYRHSFVDMSNLYVEEVGKKLCSPAMGYSFAAGTTDGPGMFHFTQGELTDNIFWNKVRDFITVTPSDDEINCQSPKPILLNTGDASVPYEWDPRIVPIQLLRLGNFFVIAVPSEFTTMSGRRMREIITKYLTESNITDGLPVYVTIAGLSNSYSSYVTTFEEYQAQRYEAASTIYGPNTLQGYIQEVKRLATDLVNNEPSVSIVSPPDLTSVQLEMMPAAKYDRLPSNSKDNNVTFGSVLTGYDASGTYKSGDTVAVTFHAANPRNNQKIQGTYITIERQKTKFPNLFDVVATDGDWSTKFEWNIKYEDELLDLVSHVSYITAYWTVPDTNDKQIKEGAYRICYHGDHKLLPNGATVPFSGCSSIFSVTV